MKKPIYLDYNATTPVAPEVLEAMMPFFSQNFANAASNHAMGWQAKAAVDQAREEVAQIIHAENDQTIIFTSGATESNNLSLRGFCEANPGKGQHIISQKTEHSSVLQPLQYLQSKGFEVTYVDCDEYGWVNPQDIENAIRKDTFLVTIMYANNEIGTLQAIREIGALCRKKNLTFHCDAAQAVGKIAVDVQKDQIDLLTASAHKMYGPKGAGFLYISSNRPAIRLSPLALGGGHERGLRSGTLAVPLIVGLGQACSLAQEKMAQDTQKAIQLRERLWQGLNSRLAHLRRNSPPDKCLPGTLSVAFEGLEGESLMMSLSEIAVTAGSACTSAKTKPSHVLSSLGYGETLAHTSLRMCIGRNTDVEEIDETIKIIAEKVNQLRVLSPDLARKAAGKY